MRAFSRRNASLACCVDVVVVSVMMVFGAGVVGIAPDVVDAEAFKGVPVVEILAVRLAASSLTNCS